MIEINYNAQTKETTSIEVSDIEVPIIEVVPVPTLAEVVEDLVVTLQDKGVLP